MKVDICVDELVGVMIENHISIAEALQELHPEFMEVLYKRLKFLKDIQNAGRMTDTRDYFRDDELDVVTYSAMRGMKGESNE